MTAEAPAQPLRRNREFRLLWVGQALSDFGSTMTYIALPLVLLAAGYGTSVAATVGTATLVAGMVTRIPAGYLADRFDQRRLMLVCDLVRLALVGSVAVFAFLGRLPIGLALVCVIGSQVAMEVFGPSQGRVLRRVVPEPQRATAVSLNQARAYAADIVAPAVAGLLVAVWRGLPFAVDAATFAVSAACVAGLRRTAAGRGTPAPEDGQRFLTRVGAGLRYVVRDRFLRLATVYFAVVNVTFQALVYALILGVGRQPGGAAVAGLAMSSAAVAGLAGSLVAPYAQRRLPLSAILAAGPVAAAVLLALAWGGGNGTVLFAAAFAMLCLFTPVTGAVLVTIMAKGVPEAIYGRVTTASGFVAEVLQPLGPLMAGLLLAHRSLGGTAGLFALALAVLGGLALTVPAPPSTVEQTTVDIPEPVGSSDERTQL